MAFTRMLRTMHPVSYTHLDVYKRQEEHLDVYNFKKKERKKEVQALEREKEYLTAENEGLTAQIAEARADIPVSYTHLDVYKRQAARSVLIVGRIKDEPEVRVVCHTKSSLAPEGKAIAFRLDKNNGFEWIGEYDIDVYKRQP